MTLLFISGTGGPRPAVGMALSSTLTAALPAFTKALAPVRVNLIAAGFVDTPLSASLLGDELENRRNQLPATLPLQAEEGVQSSSISVQLREGLRTCRQRSCVRVVESETLMGAFWSPQGPFSK